MNFTAAFGMSGNGFAATGLLNQQPFILACDDEANMLFYRNILTPVSSFQTAEAAGNGFYLLLDDQFDRLIGLDESGNSVFETIRSMSDSLRWQALAKTVQGNALVAGNTVNGEKIGWHTIGFDGAIDETHYIEANGRELNSIFSGNDSGILLAGTGQSEDSVFFTKVSDDSIIWSNAVNIGGENAVKKIAALEFGGYIIAGESQRDDYFRNPFLIATRADGSVRWHATRQIP
jgi:hypothetical protein